MARNHRSSKEETFFRDVDRARLEHRWAWVVMFGTLVLIYVAGFALLVRLAT